MRFLREELLLEDIWDLKKYFPKIDDKKYLALIQLDPTYKGGDIAGTYAKWILSLANKNKLDNIGHVTDILKRFEENKKNLKNKDIMTFKSLEDLDNYLNDKNSYKELSQRQELRQTQKAVRASDIEKDAELVYEDSNWKVYIPKTYEASCKLGRDTSWCTASTSSDYYYDMYTDQGPLYININKRTNDKYQFHFESGSFMDMDDDPIDVKSFFVTSGNENLYNFYKPLIREKLEGLKPFDDNYSILDVRMSKLAEGLSNRTWSEDFLLSCMTGDIYEQWDWTPYWYSAEELDFITTYLNDTNKEILKDHNISLDNLINELNENDALHDAINMAVNDAYNVGSQEACVKDFNKALDKAIPFKYKANQETQHYEIYLTDKDILDLYDYIKGCSTEEAFVNYTAEDFYFREPQYSWMEFDESIFNDRLNDALITEVF